MKAQVFAALLFVSVAGTAAAGSYALYYGRGTPSALEALARYESVVVDPVALGAHAKDDIALLKSHGCVVYGYLGCFEVAPHVRYQASMTNADWVVRVGGDVWHPYGKNFAVDLARPEVRVRFVELVKSEVLDFGCDGVFMDTLADLDSSALSPARRAELRDGLGKMLAGFRSAYPAVRLVGNWTIQDTLAVVSPYVSAVCWENFNPVYFAAGNSARGWAVAVTNRLAAARRVRAFEVWTLAERLPAAAEPDFARYSRALGYIPYASTDGYSAVPASARP